MLSWTLIIDFINFQKNGTFTFKHLSTSGGMNMSCEVDIRR